MKTAIDLNQLAIAKVGSEENKRPNPGKGGGTPKLQPNEFKSRE